MAPFPEQEPEPQSDVEPVPEWTAAFKVWGAAWQIHWIGFGVVFFLLAVYCIFAVIRLRLTRTVVYRKYFLAVNFLMIVLGFSRALYLWINPYESFENIPTSKCIWPTRILFAMAFPCEASAFCLIQLALLEISKVQLASPKIQNIKVILSIIIFNFLVSIVAEAVSVVEGIDKEFARGLLIACQALFIIWGFVLCVGFLYAGGKIIHSVQTTDKYFTNDLSNRETLLKSATAKVARVTIATAFLGLGLCALQIYSLIAVYELYKSKSPEPWSWHRQPVFECK